VITFKYVKAAYTGELMSESSKQKREACERVSIRRATRGRDEVVIRGEKHQRLVGAHNDIKTCKIASDFVIAHNLLILGVKTVVN
jgi:hypothetical protein